MKRLDESLLTGLAPFRQMSRAEIRAVLDLAASRRYPEGSTVFAAGFPAERFYLLLDGTIRVLRTTPEGEQIVVLHIPAGQLFGIAPAIGATTYPGTAVAASEVIALSWPSRLWSDFTARYPGFGLQAMRTIGQRLGELHARIADLATRQVEQRVAAALMQMAAQGGRRTTGGGIEIAFPVTRQNIADMTGSTLFTVSRLLSAWEQAGLVASRRRHIAVTDPHRLMLVASPPPA
ncbi:MAG: Crp/Fnr family transcriptional regulator [Rhodobacteraceae bacterium]|nr:Crp/Fnr family transcriptional regulator [Paracoccaceae bacterium]